MSEDERRALMLQAAHVLRGPLTFLAYGLALLLLVLIVKWSGVLDAAGSFFYVKDAGERVGILLFLVGLSFVALLWWLCWRHFRLLQASQVTGQGLLDVLKDLPMALPEGTVRAIIALIVGVMGLPLLLFSNVLGLKTEIAGYVNGIVIGVFSYYFGSRTAGADGQTTRQTVRMLDQAQEAKKELEKKVDVLRDVAGAAQAGVQRSDFARELDRLQRHVGSAQVLIDVLGPALPPGLLPEGAADALRKARVVLGTASSLGEQGVTAGTVQEVAAAAEALVGRSPLTALVRSASGLLPLVAGVPPAAGVALLMGVAWRLGSEQYRRWIARVLDAPYDPQLISMGQVTSVSMELALEQSPTFRKGFTDEELQRPAFYSGLLDMVLRDDAADRLWSAYGADAHRFASRGELEEALVELRRALLWDQSGQDFDPAHLAATVQALDGTALAVSAAPPPQQLQAAVRKVAQRGDAPAEALAAMDALILLTGHLREAKVDPVPLIAEAWRN